MPNDFDVIIIGSGAGGGSIAYTLADTGKRILILERGSFLPREKRNWDPEFIFGSDGYKANVRWEGPDGEDIFPILYYRVGGNTKMYGALLHRQRPEDFLEQRHKGGISPAWPVGYDEYEPYYMMAEHVMKIHGNRGEDLTEGWSSGPFPFRAFPHEPRIQEVADNLAAMGLHPHHSNLALNRDMDEPWRRPCIACNTCDPFPCMLHAKSDAETALVRPALKHDNVTLWTGSRVDKLIQEGGKITRIELTRDGEAMSLSADLVVVSCGAIQTAALLLRSGVANSSDQVGRNFTKHNQSGISAMDYRKPNDTVFQKTLSVHDFYHGGPDMPYPLGTVQMTGKAHWTRIMGDYAFLDMTEERAREVQQYAVDFWFTSEDLPDANNRVEWTDRGVKFNYRPNNRASHYELMDHFQENYLKPQGFTDFIRSTKELQFTWHQAGTAQFGTDPKKSVLDTNCKAWDLDNLYVVDASFQPSQGATNPTLTIIANGIRVGEHLRREWFSQEGVSLEDFPLSDGYMADNAGANIRDNAYSGGDDASWGA
ncbi:choline dehydrogenase-like flavoprotein [Lewinella aquimaris]|uniref:Choline dehydrogenase-like flavoprotein n=1 Tax=Neolewinella aquimaris TaxID=1835722 RepID=A0A840DW77_9BACT|nr:GMC family oxidoreductase [Neolewinella aquimaris]MBB4077424.1 choline dehydrogenase-like flavoprotein [Neolewinella aquimaris]